MSENDRVRILFGEALEVLRTLDDESVYCVVTSPPYWQLRDYGRHTSTFPHELARR